jgi:gag-polypeptide of LTR copia-type/GAG-pre-integrase domain
MSNHLCLKVMQKTIPESFRGHISDSTLALDYLKELEQRFVRNEKAEIDILLNKLCTMKYNDRSNVREHILKMMNIASKLKVHKLDISKDMLVYLSLNSFFTSFGQFKMSYNRQKKSWTINELISHYVQEEERLKTDKNESTNIASTSKEQGKQKRKVNSDAATTNSQKKPTKDKKSIIKTEPDKEKKGYFFCESEGHMKKNCTNYHAWRAKKDNFSLVCEEVNSVSVLIDTWWIDSGTNTHISVSMQGCRNYRKPRYGERYIYVGDDNKAEVEAIGHFRLILKTGLYLNLFATFVVPSFRQNLISISALDKLGFSCSFGDEKFSLYRHSNIVASGFLSVMDNFYTLDIIASYNETLNNETRNVRQKLTHQDSAALWHKRLSHISQQRITHLVQSKILWPLNMSDLGPCIKCVKGK